MTTTTTTTTTTPITTPTTQPASTTAAAAPPAPNNNNPNNPPTNLQPPQLPSRPKNIIRNGISLTSCQLNQKMYENNQTVQLNCPFGFDLIGNEELICANDVWLEITEENVPNCQVNKTFPNWRENMRLAGGDRFAKLRPGTWRFNVLVVLGSIMVGIIVLLLKISISLNRQIKINKIIIERRNKKLRKHRERRERMQPKPRIQYSEDPQYFYY